MSKCITEGVGVDNNDVSVTILMSISEFSSGMVSGAGGASLAVHLVTLRDDSSLIDSVLSLITSEATLRGGSGTGVVATEGTTEAIGVDTVEGDETTVPSGVDTVEGDEIDEIVCSRSSERTMIVE